VLRGVALGEAVTHLGDLSFEPGTTLAVQQCKDLNRRVHMEVSVRSVTGPPFEELWRHLGPEYESILFSGLGPGRYHVWMTFGSGSPNSISREIDVDGRTPVTITAER
jgi:hypothetical protein